MSKLDELKEIVRLNRLGDKLYKECQERLNRFTPEAQEAELQETIRLVAELEMVHAESKEKWADWKSKYPNG